MEITPSEFTPLIERCLEDASWASFYKKVDSDGDTIYNFPILCDSCFLKGRLIIYDSPKYIRIGLTLPYSCAPEYGLAIDEFIAHFNYYIRIGAMQHDEKDLEFKYSYYYTNGFEIDDFKRLLNTCIISTCKVAPDLAKLSVGKFSAQQASELLANSKTLLESLGN
jgi:hypothetical protein